MGGYHSAIRVLIKHNTQIIQPLDSLRSLHNQLG